MEKLHYSIKINAPKEKVWNTMLNKGTYEKWTEVFSPGSTYKGDWNKGSKILFIGPSEQGEMGMVSLIADNQPYKFISIEHIGELMNGVEDTTSDRVKRWAGAHENYTFKENNGHTEVQIDVDTVEEYTEMFQGMWPKALQKLKEITENE